MDLLVFATEAVVRSISAANAYAPVANVMIPAATAVIIEVFFMLFLLSCRMGDCYLIRTSLTVVRGCPAHLW
jgi:hypothetical protein